MCHMGRPKTHAKTPSRTNVSLPPDLKKAASKYAFECDFSGGLSELISRLLVAELDRKNIAVKYGRNLKA